MIEINLIPDVKRELLRAQKLRNIITTVSIMAGIAAIGVVVLLSIIVFGVQGVASLMADNNIKDEQGKLEARNGTVEALTIQSQLSHISGLEDKKYLVSRVFGTFSTPNPDTDILVVASEIKLDKETNTLTIEGQSDRGFEGLEAFKKSAERTVLYYRDKDSKVANSNYTRSGKCKYKKTEGKGKYSKVNMLSKEVAISEQSYGKDADGKRVLRFTLELTLDEHVLAFNSFDEDAIDFCGPNKQNVTDSYVQVPKNLFAAKASDVEEEGK